MIYFRDIIVRRISEIAKRISEPRKEANAPEFIHLDYITSREAPPIWIDSFNRNYVGEFAAKFHGKEQIQQIPRTKPEWLSGNKQFFIEAQKEDVMAMDDIVKESARKANEECKTNEECPTQELNKAVIEKLTRAFNSQEFENWTLADYGSAQDKWKKQGLDEKSIEERLCVDPRPVYWFRYLDEHGRNHEYKIVDREGLKGDLDPAIFDWETDTPIT
jgi:hypothetical protein